MHINNKYLLSRVAHESVTPSARALDYGCGAGEVVEEARRIGLDMYGVEVLYEGANDKAEIERKGLLGHIVRTMNNGVIPFEDNFFDFVVSNQVFEHVEDLDGALKEIDRVLKPGGGFLCVFP